MAVVDEQFLQSILRRKENDPSLVVTNCKISNGVGDGEGYLSSMLRVEADVKQNASREKLSLIVKTLPTDVGSAGYVAETSAFPVEIRAFSEILPKVRELLKSVGKPPGIGPEFYYCQPNIPYMLIIEDLCASGFKMADRREGLDLDHCLLVMKTLGRYHASNIVLHDSDPDSIEKYNINFFTDPSFNSFCENAAYLGLTSVAPVADALFPNGENYGERLTKRAKTLRQDYRKLLDVNRSGFNVLLHGDLWLNNMMFRYNETDGKVEEVKFLDFQLVMYGSPGIDFNYFFNSSLTDEVRFNHVDDLLKAYHSELSETLALLGYKGEVSFQDVYNEYYRLALFGFMVAVVCQPIFRADADNDFDIPRIARNDNVEPGFHKRARNPSFQSILKKVLPLYDKLGAF